MAMVDVCIFWPGIADQGPDCTGFAWLNNAGLFNSKQEVQLVSGLVFSNSGRIGNYAANCFAMVLDELPSNKWCLD